MTEETKETSEDKSTEPAQVPKETVAVILLSECKVGDKGILLRPVGSHCTDPFILQDIDFYLRCFEDEDL